MVGGPDGVQTVIFYPAGEVQQLGWLGQTNWMIQRFDAGGVGEAETHGSRLPDSSSRGALWRSAWHRRRHFDVGGGKGLTT